MLLGKFLQEVRHDYDGAEAAYRKGLELEPDDVWNWMTWGHFMADVKGNLDEAEIAFKKMQHIDPTDTGAPVFLGKVQRLRKSKEGPATAP
jgi:predicted TPR repeat methyltransferase